VNAKWIQNGITVAGGNRQGICLNQLSNPWGVYIDDDQTIYVADTSNHRIVEWKRGTTVGQVVAGGNSQGNKSNQLSSPTSVIVNKKSGCFIICDYENKRVVKWSRQNGTKGETIISNVDCCGLSMDNDEYLYISDTSKHEVRRWKIGETNGTVVAGGNRAGNRFDQLNGPYYIFADQDHSVYVSDRNNHRVMKWMKGAKEGIVVAGGQGQGNGLAQLSNPRGVIVDQLGTVYVVDQGNLRAMRWLKGATQGSVVVGGNGGGGHANQFNFPMGLSFDRQNNLYVVDHGNHRVQKFDLDQNSN
jgi:sugar lactone lactonase YvrE